MSIENDHKTELAGLRILIVEDMGMIAYELEQMLDDLGCDIVGIASRLHEAMRISQTTERLDGVLLDLNLSNETAYPVAEVLHERGIPFIIMSGYEPSHIRADFADVTHLQKPFGRDELVTTMLNTFCAGRTSN